MQSLLTQSQGPCLAWASRAPGALASVPAPPMCGILH